MKALVLFLIMLLTSFYQPVRPPALTPVDVPFAYDSSKVTSDVLKFFEVRPSSRVLILPVSVKDADGEYGTLTCSDPSVVIPPAITSVDPDDPNGISRLHEYACEIRVGTVTQILYAEFTWTDDPNGESYAPMSDTRMYLIDVRKRNSKPVIVN